MIKYCPKCGLQLKYIIYDGLWEYPVCTVTCKYGYDEVIERLIKDGRIKGV